MAFTFSNSGSFTWVNANNIAQTFNNNSGDLLVVIIGLALGSLTSVKYDGASLTQAVQDGSGNSGISVWYLVNPSTGTHFVEITTSSASADGVVSILSYSGVKTSGSPINATNTNGGFFDDNTGQSLPITTGVSGSLVVTGLWNDSSTLAGTAGGTGHTERLDFYLGTDVSMYAGDILDAGVPAQKIPTWSWTSTPSTEGLWAVVSFSPAAGTSTSTTTTTTTSSTTSTTTSSSTSTSTTFTGTTTSTTTTVSTTTVTTTSSSTSTSTTTSLPTADIPEISIEDNRPTFAVVQSE